jgi:hypothetical protein
MSSNETVLIFLAGTIATAITDVWVVVREQVFRVPRPNYGLVGRWIAHMAKGRLRHESIGAAEVARGEKPIGWIAHYAIGVGFAFLLPAIWGAQWIRHPTLPPALIVGIATVVAPYFVMQPAMGAGVAASRTPRPNASRLHSLVMHAVFGLGLYAAALFVSSLATGE